MLCSFSQFHQAGVQGQVLLLQKVYTNIICLQLLLHIQKHISCTWKILSEQVYTYNMINQLTKKNKQMETMTGYKNIMHANETEAIGALQECT